MGFFQRLLESMVRARTGLVMSGHAGEFIESWYAGRAPPAIEPARPDPSFSAQDDVIRHRIVRAAVRRGATRREVVALWRRHYEAIGAAEIPELARCRTSSPR
jgi:hypothetical protein